MTTSFFRRRTGAIPLLLVVVMLLLGGCRGGAPANARPVADPALDGDGGARLNIFLVLERGDGPAVRLRVEELDVLAGDLWLPVGRGALDLDSAAIGSGQVFLGGRRVPPGSYRRLRLTVSGGAVRDASGLYAPVAPGSVRVEVPFPAPLRLEQDDSRSLLVVWNVQSSVENPENGSALRPVLSVAPAVRPMLVDLVFAACPDIDTVFVVRADRNWVVDSFGVTGRPTYLALDPDPARQRLYVLASREGAVRVVDLSSYRVVDLFRIPLDTPNFMTISPDGLWAFLLDERSGFLSRMDLSTGRIAARVLLGHRPGYAAFLKERNLLALSLALSQTVLLLDPLSLAPVGTLATGSGPQGVTAVGDRFYVAESGDHTLSVVDLGSRRSVGRLTAGFGPRRVLEAEGYVYVGNYDGGSLSVLLPEQMGIIREIHGLGRPLEMAYDPLRRQLYVADEEAAALAVADTTAHLLLGWIPLGARPLGLALVR